MGTGFHWEPFRIDVNEYDEVQLFWKTMNYNEDVKLIKPYKGVHIPFVFDDEILNIKTHIDYLQASRVKYENVFIALCNPPSSK